MRDAHPLPPEVKVREVKRVAWHYGADWTGRTVSNGRQTAPLPTRSFNGIRCSLADKTCTLTHASLQTRQGVAGAIPNFTRFADLGGSVSLLITSCHRIPDTRALLSVCASRKRQTATNFHHPRQDKLTILPQFIHHWSRRPSDKYSPRSLLIDISRPAKW